MERFDDFVFVDVFHAEAAREFVPAFSHALEVARNEYGLTPRHDLGFVVVAELLAE